MKTIWILLASLSHLLCGAQPLTLGDGVFGAIAGGAVVSGGGGTCTTAVDMATNAPTTSWGLFDRTGRMYAATKFTATDTYTACSTEFWMTNQGSPTMIITARIWADNSGVPGTLLYSSDAFDSSAVVGGWYKMTFSGASITNGAVYWVGMSGSPMSTFAYVKWGQTSLAGSTYVSTNGTSWVSLDAHKFNFRTYK